MVCSSVAGGVAPCVPTHPNGVAVSFANRKNNATASTACCWAFSSGDRSSDRPRLRVARRPAWRAGSRRRRPAASWCPAGAGRPGPGWRCHGAQAGLPRAPRATAATQAPAWPREQPAAAAGLVTQGHSCQPAQGVPAAQGVALVRVQLLQRPAVACAVLRLQGHSHGRSCSCQQQHVVGRPLAGGHSSVGAAPQPAQQLHRRGRAEHDRAPGSLQARVLQLQQLFPRSPTVGVAAGLALAAQLLAGRRS